MMITDPKYIELAGLTGLTMKLKMMCRPNNVNAPKWKGITCEYIHSVMRKVMLWDGPTPRRFGKNLAQQWDKALTAHCERHGLVRPHMMAYVEDKA